MLERIVNISAGSDYKNSSKPNRYNKSSNYLSTFSSSLSDSISLSPATAFLSSVNWYLKKLKKNNNKIEICFEFDGFDFTANVNQSGAYFQNNIEYDIKKITEMMVERFEVQILILSRLNHINNNMFDPKFHLTVLSDMINKIIEFSRYSYSISVDSTGIMKIFSGLEYGLRNEFDYINTCLLSFLEKYLTVKADILNDEMEYDNTLIMEKIHLKTF